MPPKETPKKGKKKLPKWAIPVGVIVGAALFYWFFLRNRTGGTYDAGGGGQPFPQAPSTDAASSGAPASNAAPSDSLSPDVLGTLQDQLANYVDSRTQDLYGRTSDLGNQISGLSDQLASLGAGYSTPFFDEGTPTAAAGTTTTSQPGGTKGSAPFGGIVKTDRDAKTGVKNTYYANGRIVTQAPGRTAYVSRAGGGAAPVKAQPKAASRPAPRAKAAPRPHPAPAPKKKAKAPAKHR